MTPEQIKTQRDKLQKVVEIVIEQYGIIWGSKNGHEWSVDKMLEECKKNIKEK